MDTLNIEHKVLTLHKNLFHPPWKTGLSKEHYYWIRDNLNLLMYCFIWKESPQGHEFWSKEYDSKTLSPEADLILRSWAGLVKPRKIKPIEWV